MDIPIKTLAELAIQFCYITEYKDYSAMIHKYKKRTKLDKILRAMFY